MVRGGSRHANAPVARVLEVVIRHVVDMGVDPPPQVDVLAPLGFRAVIEEVDEDAPELHLGAPLAGVGEDGEVEVHRAIFAELLREAWVTVKVTWAGQRMTKNMAIKAVAARVAKSVARM